MKYLTISAVAILFFSCSKPTPEDLAKDSCDCFHEAKSIQNSDNQNKKLQDCTEQNDINIRRLKEIEQDENMDNKQVQDFEARFYKIYSNCN